MYHYIEKNFLKNLKCTCSGIVGQLVQRINNDGKMKVVQHMVGSGAKNLVTQNGKEPIDLDYNLEIVMLNEFDWDNCKDIKNYIMEQFNYVLNKNGWNNCKDSTSVITTDRRYFTHGNRTPWSIDVAIVCQDDNKQWYRLIHKKTGYSYFDSWVWELAPNSKKLSKKVEKLKKTNHWNPEVSEIYLEKKNMYLRRNDLYHPSFICYIETINEMYNKYFG